VCAGLAAHLRIDVKHLRIFMILLGLAGGIGVVAYVFLWITIPAGEPEELARELDPSARLAKPLIVDESTGDSPSFRFREWLRRIPVRDIAFGLILLTVTVLLVAYRFGYQLQWSWVLSVLVVGAGLLLAWSQLDSAQRGQLLGTGTAKTPASVLRLAGGVGLVVVGVLMLVGRDQDQSPMMQSLIAAIAVLLGVALVLAPWWLRLVNQLGEERAEIAAHLHDSVLQTLALIQRSAGRPGEVTRLARNQERELRAWLYNDRASSGTSLAEEARAIVAQVENDLVLAGGGDETISIDLVVVGDAVPDQDSEALLAAMAEALKNAVRHGEPPVSAYLEVRDEALEVYVTDRGEGFDISQIAPDRFGVRESIIGRVERRGGAATFRKMAVGGTEVSLRIPRKATETSGEQSAESTTQRGEAS
jgi:signal transduction histidine kinase/phage shock protein PspC (stress-responsive transcriptional regulator)